MTTVTERARHYAVNESRVVLRAIANELERGVSAARLVKICRALRFAANELDELYGVRPCCPSCSSEDTVNFGADRMDDGSDRWGCGLCGNEFLVVVR